jgi:hypothetical protein
MRALDAAPRASTLPTAAIASIPARAVRSLVVVVALLLGLILLSSPVAHLASGATGQ